MDPNDLRERVEEEIKLEIEARTSGSVRSLSGGPNRNPYRWFSTESWTAAKWTTPTPDVREGRLSF